MSTQETTENGTTLATTERGTATHWGTIDIVDAPLSFEDDASKVEKSALPKLATILESTFAQAQTWADSAAGLSRSTEALARLSWEARALCHRQDGAIDWAAKTTAYDALYADRLHAFALAPMKDDGTGGLGLTEKGFQKLRTAVSSWANDNDYRNLFIALHGAKTDPAVRKVANEIGPKMPLPEVAADYIRSQVGAQKSTQNKTLPGWDPVNAPKAGAKVGLTKQERRKAETQADAGNDNASDRTPSSYWEKVRVEVAKTTVVDGDNAPWLSPLSCTNETYRLLSVLGVKLMGAEDEQRPTVRDSQKVAATLRKMAALCTILADGTSGKDREKVKREDVAKLYWAKAKDDQ